MLTFYAVENEKLKIVSTDEATSGLQKIVWCDLFQPSREEEHLVEGLFEIEIPTRDEMVEIELSNRLYQYNGTIFTTTTMVAKADTVQPETHAVSFILSGSALITLRYAESYSFKAYLGQLGNRKGEYYEGIDAMCDLLELTINRVADLLENTGHKLDDINATLFRASIEDKVERQQKTPDFEELLLQVGICGDLLSKIREGMVSLTRLIGFASGTSYFEESSAHHARSLIMLRDISALNEQAGFLSGRLNFLLDTTLGMIGIQQTSIIKIFSVASVVFLPPTLVASVYGMNFDFIPELHKDWGYPYSIALMILSALLPYLYFKRRKWL